MDGLIVDHAYIALFLLSFLASTVVPVGSEWLLVAVLLNGALPVPAVLIATLGNTLGACTTYAIGLYGGDYLVKKLLRTDDETLQRAQRVYTRYGSWSLLFSWVPFIGDPLCALSGLLRANFPLFLLLVLIGKLARYMVVARLTLAAAGAPAM